MNMTYSNPGNLKHRSDVVVHNGVAYVAGAVPADVGQDMRGQTEQVLAQIDARLAAVGSDKGKLLSATIWLVDVNGDVADFNAVWNAWVVPGRLPARACVQAELQVGARVEVAVIAAV